VELGGLALIDLQTEIRISTLKYMRDSIYSGKEIGKLMLLNIKFTQLESGLDVPLMENPGLHISYLTPTWITSVRQFLSQHNVKNSVTDTLRIQMQGKNYRCIMNLEALTQYTPVQQ
jgi:hypothetical protein